MTKKKFDVAFESIMSGSIPEKQSFFEKLVINAIIQQIEDVLGIDATYIGNYTFEWEFANNIKCQIMIADNGQIFASAANPYPGDKEAIDNDDYQLFDDHSYFIYTLDDIVNGDFNIVLRNFIKFNN